jgi:hypothetical protein
MTTRQLARQILELRKHGVVFTVGRRLIEPESKQTKELRELRNQDWRDVPSWMEGQ